MLYFVRHGESEANVRHEFSNRGFKQGLTAGGFEQAAALAETLRGERFVQAYTSPVKRAFQTAKVLCKTLEIPLTVTEALREYDVGELEGRSDSEGWTIFNQVFKRWVDGDWAARIPGGESYLDIQARFVPFVDDVVRRWGDEMVLLVGHGGLYRCMLPLIFDNLDIEMTADLPFDYVMPIIGEVYEGELVCRQWGERALCV